MVLYGVTMWARELLAWIFLASLVSPGFVVPVLAVRRFKRWRWSRRVPAPPLPGSGPLPPPAPKAGSRWIPPPAPGSGPLPPPDDWFYDVGLAYQYHSSDMHFDSRTGQVSPHLPPYSG